VIVNPITYSTQIETALERVRAASMAMQTSEQLLDVIKVVGQQLEKLGLQFDSTNFRTNVREKDWNLWIYAKWMDKPAKWFIPYIDHPYFKMTDKDGEVVSSIFSRQEKDSFEAYLYKLGLIVPPKDPEVAARQKKFMDAAKGFAMSIANVKSVSLNIANSQAQPYSKEDNALLLRFAVVFEQAYVRFLDLQKAEAQARESQIQLALERVRAKTMAMQKSEELSSLINEVFVRLTELDLKMDSATMLIVDKKTNVTDYWIAAEKFNYSTRFSVPPLTDGIMAKNFQAAWQSKEDFIYVYNQKDKNEYLNFLFTHSDFRKLPDERKQFLLNTKVYNLAYALMEEGALVMTRFTEQSFTPTEHQTLKRFAKIFEQCYTRFLDLQKAEAQAREAQIEAALE
ncbi:MAG: hypothetical protein ACKO13_01155, partial [Cytophagales bacterium]